MSSVLARPGTPTNRQWPRANSAISSWSMTALLADDALLDLGLDVDARARDLLDGAQIGWGLGYHDVILASLLPGAPACARALT